MSVDDRTQKVTPSAERMRIAAEMRFAQPGVTWDAIATHVGVTRKCLWQWRSSEAWEIISRDVALSHGADLVADAIAALRLAWSKGNPTGALEILRAYGIVRVPELNVKSGKGDAIEFTLIFDRPDEAPTVP